MQLGCFVVSEKEDADEHIFITLGLRRLALALSPFELFPEKMARAIQMAVLFGRSGRTAANCDSRRKEEEVRSYICWASLLCLQLCSEEGDVGCVLKHIPSIAQTVDTGRTDVVKAVCFHHHFALGRRAIQPPSFRSHIGSDKVPLFSPDFLSQPFLLRYK